MIGTEDLCVATRDYLIAHLPAQIDLANASREPAFAVSPPSEASIHIGPWSRYATYALPALFVVSPQGGTMQAGQTHDKWSHDLLIAGVVQGDGVERVIRLTYRLAEAVYGTVHDSDPLTGPDTSAKLLVRGVDWGTLFRAREATSVFRADFTLRMTATLHTLATPIG